MTLLTMPEFWWGFRDGFLIGATVIAALFIFAYRTNRFPWGG